MRVPARYSTWFAALALSTSAFAQTPAQPSAAVADGTVSASFRIIIQGRPVGTEDVSVISLDGRTVIRSTGGIEGGNFSLRSAEIVYGPGLAPQRMSMEMAVRGQQQTVETTFTQTTATSTITQGEAVDTKTDTVSPSTVIFPNNVFGAVEGLARRLVTMSAGETLPVYGKGDQVRDWLFVEDHVRALQAVFERGRVGRTYNVGGNNEKQNIEVVQAVCAILDRLRPRGDGKSYAEQIGYVADRPGHDKRYAIDASRIRDELGWEPAETFETGIEKTVAWYLANEAWWRPLVEAKASERRGIAA